jgi:hypothetical protein
MTGPGDTRAVPEGDAMPFRTSERPTMADRTSGRDGGAQERPMVTVAT